MSYAIDCYGLTDAGRVREVNEDQFLVADLDKSMLIRQTSLPPDDHTRLLGPHRGHLFLVADGLGGPPGGRRASRLATEALIRYVLTTLPWFLRLRHDEEHDLGEELVAALKDCQRRVKEAQAADPGRGRMATTLTMAYVLWPRLYVVHAGDTRAYLLRGGALHQVTRDHTVARQLVEAGRMTPEADEDSRWSHVLYNCVGGRRDELDPDVYKAVLRPGDVLLVCSDGLTQHLADGRIAEVLGSGSAEAAARRLTPSRRARRAGFSPSASPRRIAARSTTRASVLRDRESLVSSARSSAVISRRRNGFRTRRGIRHILWLEGCRVMYGNLADAPLTTRYRELTRPTPGEQGES